MRIVFDTTEADTEQGDYALLAEARILHEVVGWLRHVSSVEVPEALGDEDNGLAERAWATAEMLEQVIADWMPMTSRKVLAHDSYPLPRSDEGN